MEVDFNMRADNATNNREFKMVAFITSVCNSILSKMNVFSFSFICSVDRGLQFSVYLSKKKIKKLFNLELVKTSIVKLLDTW